MWQSSVQPVGYKELGSVPNITGTLWGSIMQGMFNNQGSGAFTGEKDDSLGVTKAPGVASEYNLNNKWIFNASRSSSCYGRSGDIVIPTAVVIKFCIKY